MSTQPGLFDGDAGIPTRSQPCVECGEPRKPGSKPGRFCSPRCRITNSEKRRAEEAAKKAAGQARAADAHAWELQVCRRIAREIAQATGTADIERVRERVEDMGLELRWGNWTWAVFRGEEWEPTGGFVEVRHRGGRRRGGGVRVWRIKA